MQFTVAICTYNGANRLPEVLQCLQQQISTENITWEILVVDNNSTDNTAQVVAGYNNVRYCFESQQGAGFARQRAIREAAAPLIGFLDDDNLPEPDWVAAAVAFHTAHPEAGAYGSQIFGDFEAEPPPNFEQLAPFFALTQRGPEPKLYEPGQKVLPPSAGLVVQKQVWLDTVPDRCILSGRKPGSMLTGEDLEVLAYIQKAGYSIWYNPAMQLKHKIPKNRLQKEYLIPFFRGIGHSRHVTRMLSVPNWARPLALVGYALNDIRKIILLLIKYKNHIKTELIPACQLELFIGSLNSPFYLWKNGYLSLVNGPLSLVPWR